MPNKKKESMAIYLLFIQNVLWALDDGGKAAIVVPTGFLTAQSGIERKIRERLIDENWLQGVISMPSNIFANTGTNVSVAFINKAKKDDKVILVDASKMGEKRKEGKNQRTVLRNNEVQIIIDTFTNCKEVDDFSIVVSNDQIKEKNYSFSAGQYFEVKIEYVEITEEQFNEKIKGYEENLGKLFAEGQELEGEIKKQMEELKYEG